MPSSILKKIKRELNRLPKRFIKQFWDTTLKTNESVQRQFVTYHARPKRSTEIGVFSDKIVNAPLAAIVIQGQIIKDNDFTLETIKIYKKIFDDALIILSAWEDEDPNYLKKFEEEGIEVVLNKKPNNFGQQNINLQLVSSYNGLLHAQKCGVQYALKTRADQRMYGTNNMQFLINMLEQYPVVQGYKQKKRLLGISLNTFKYRLYGLSDMFIFGCIEDMLLYWGAELDSRQAVDTNNATMREFCMARVCEVYIVTEFLAKIGRNITWTLKDSWHIFADHFCVIDKESVDIYWFKYERYKEHRQLDYTRIRILTEMAFKDWINIYSTFSLGRNIIKEIPESVLDNRIKDGVVHRPLD